MRKLLIFLSTFFVWSLTFEKILLGKEIIIKKQNGVAIIYNSENPVFPPNATTKLIIKEDFFSNFRFRHR